MFDCSREGLSDRPNLMQNYWTKMQKRKRTICNMELWIGTDFVWAGLLGFKWNISWQLALGTIQWRTGLVESNHSLDHLKLGHSLGELVYSAGRAILKTQSTRTSPDLVDSFRYFSPKMLFHLFCSSSHNLLPAKLN